MESVAVVFHGADGAVRYGEVIEVRDKQDTGDRLRVKVLAVSSYHNKSIGQALVRTPETLQLQPELVRDKLKLCDLWNHLTSDKPTLYLESDSRTICVCGLALEPSSDLVGCFVCRKIYHEACRSRCQTCGGELSAFVSLGTSKRIKVSEERGLKAPLDKRLSSALINIAKYSLLMPENQRLLEGKLSRLQQDYLGVQMTLSDDEKVRQQIRDKLTAALLLAQQEQACLGTPVNIPDSKIKQLAMEIEAFMHISNESRISSLGYKNKFRALQFNFTDVNNPDFRSNVLRGTISAERLMEMESKDMASSAMKQLRQAREQKYFEEQIYCPTTGAKLMVKTHKGEAVIEMNESTIKETSTDLLEVISHKQQVEEDPFDPRVYESTMTLPKQVDSIMLSQTKDWLPDAVVPKLKDRLKQYFSTEQAESLSQRLYSA